MDLTGNKFFKKVYDDCDELVTAFSQKAKEGPEKSAEYRYKIIVMTLLPILCSRIRAVFFFCSFVLGFLFALGLKLLLM